MAADADDLSDLVPQTWVVDDATFEWLQRQLDEPPKPDPRLAELLSRPTVFDDPE